MKHADRQAQSTGFGAPPGAVCEECGKSESQVEEGGVSESQVEEGGVSTGVLLIAALGTPKKSPKKYLCIEHHRASKDAARATRADPNDEEDEEGPSLPPEAPTYPDKWPGSYVKLGPMPLGKGQKDKIEKAEQRLEAHLARLPTQSVVERASSHTRELAQLVARAPLPGTDWLAAKQKFI
jgi:hypothetical protein